MKHAIFFLLIPIFFIIFLLSDAYAKTYVVILRNGGMLAVSHYIIEGDNVQMTLESMPDSTMVISKDEIKKIVTKEIDDSEDQAEFISKSIVAKFVLIPAGTFMMGSNDPECYSAKTDSSDTRTCNESYHQVKLTEPFYMQTTVVTQGQWKKFMGENPSRFNGCGDDCPVENISWNKASLFISALNAKENTNKYRLPTEAEWEYAARAETTTKFYTGNCLTSDQANFLGNYPLSGCPESAARYRTTPVRRFNPNSWGLYDMHGNVWQWVSTDPWGGVGWGKGLYIDPVGYQHGDTKVIRGGGWDSSAAQCRSASRSSLQKEQIRSNVGFRIAKTPYWSSPSVRDVTTARFSKQSFKASETVY